MEKDKPQGLNSIPQEFYLKFLEACRPAMLEMFNKVLQIGSFNGDVNTAIISLLCKQGKDPRLCLSCRPIFLLHSDLKMLSKLQHLN